MSAYHLINRFLFDVKNVLPPGVRILSRSQGSEEDPKTLAAAAGRATGAVVGAQKMYVNPSRTSSWTALL